jgi:hypothetical protein
MRDSHVTCVMSCKHDLMPEQSQKASRSDEPLCSQGNYEENEDAGVSDKFLPIFDVTTLIETLLFDPFMKLLILLSNVPLGLCIERRKVLNIIFNLFLHDLCCVCLRSQMWSLSLSSVSYFGCPCWYAFYTYV